jgi:hypothetical protein
VNVRREYTTVPAPSADWSTAGPCSHAVQFYENDGHLLDLLMRFAGPALVAGDVAIVIATKPHRDGLTKRLRANGLDIDVPRRQGRFIALDAAATLARFCSGNAINPQAFHEVIGGILEKIAGAGERRRIVAFGEMVALLWADGRGEAAIQLEQLWNDLGRRYAFSLCCAYPMHGFGHGHAATFMKICAQHSHVFTVARANPGRALAASR